MRASSGSSRDGDGRKQGPGRRLRAWLARLMLRLSERLAGEPAAPAEGPFAQAPKAWREALARVDPALLEGRKGWRAFRVDGEATPADLPPAPAPPPAVAAATPLPEPAPVPEWPAAAFPEPARDRRAARRIASVTLPPAARRSAAPGLPPVDPPARPAPPPTPPVAEVPGRPAPAAAPDQQGSTFRPKPRFLERAPAPAGRPAPVPLPAAVDAPAAALPPLPGAAAGSRRELPDLVPEAGRPSPAPRIASAPTSAVRPAVDLPPDVTARPGQWPTLPPVHRAPVETIDAATSAPDVPTASGRIPSAPPPAASRWPTLPERRARPGGSSRPVGRGLADDFAARGSLEAGRGTWTG